MPILNQREYRLAKARIEYLRSSLTSSAAVSELAVEMPAKASVSRRTMIQDEVRKLAADIRQYESWTATNVTEGQRVDTNDAGLIPIVGRVSRGLSQKEFAKRLGMKEQQLQRYEAERYSGISLTNYVRILGALGIYLHPQFGPIIDPMISDDESMPTFSNALEREIYARQWMPESTPIARYVRASNDLQQGKPLYRLNTRSNSSLEHAALVAWGARVVTEAARYVGRQRKFDFVQSTWLGELVKLSSRLDGPAAAIGFLADHGIAVVIEPQLPGTKLDGAAFLLASGNPAIGLTLRYDRLDYFWFTLLHEIGHVLLHFDKGLAAGFFDDDIEGKVEDKVELEADHFAEAALIPDAIWETSLARFAKNPKLIVDFAKQIGVAPAIVAGRTRHERGDYRVFSNLVGQGELKRLFPSFKGDES